MGEEAGEQTLLGLLMALGAGLLNGTVISYLAQHLVPNSCSVSIWRQTKLSPVKGQGQGRRGWCQSSCPHGTMSGA